MFWEFSSTFSYIDTVSSKLLFCCFFLLESHFSVWLFLVFRSFLRVSRRQKAIEALCRGGLVESLCFRVTGKKPRISLRDTLDGAICRSVILRLILAAPCSVQNLSSLTRD